jgi:[acyl-carrier-protein] S-malonyltransferase
MDVKADLDEFARRQRKIFSTLISGILAAAVACRNRNRDNHEYHKGVIEPYEKLAAMRDECESRVGYPNISRIEMALNSLLSIFNTKKVPLHEQRKRFDRLFAGTGVGELFMDFKIPGSQSEFPGLKLEI